MNALGFAWLSLVRRPARAALAILGVAAVGGLLFDMLLLSEGLVVSMRDLLDRSGFDVRVSTSDDVRTPGPRLRDASSTVESIAALPGVRSALGLRLTDARLERDDYPPVFASLQGFAGGPGRPWTLLRGADVNGPGEIVINQSLAAAWRLDGRTPLLIRASCLADSDALPTVALTVVGVAQFPFEISGQQTAGGTLTTLDGACGGNGRDQADMIMVTSRGDADAVAAAIGRRHPTLRAVTNAEMLGAFRERGFTYFRQISAVLTTVTVGFALLLITVLLTVSVNQRLGEIAALRALGLSRRRVVADVIWESALIVGIGGVLSLPLGVGLALWLDRILKDMPGIPADLHFFVFKANALGVHLGLLVLTAVAAALYPMRIVARLPIAATLRREVVS